MKRIALVLMINILCVVVYAQSPQKINYQSVVRDQSGSMLVNQSVDFQFSIVRNGLDTVYQEEHIAVITNNFGLANLIIGQGNVLQGSFGAIDWSNGSYNLVTHINIGQGYTFIGSSGLISVPYAFHADTANFAYNTSNHDHGVSSGDGYPRMIGYGGGLGASSRNVMRNSFQDEDVLVMSSGSYLIYVHSPLSGMQRRDIRDDYANAEILLSSVVINGSLYLLFNDDVSGDHVVYQYNVANINSGGTQVVVNGQALGQVVDNVAMTSDGNDIYFSHNAANSNNDYEIARYSIDNSATFTYQSTITCSNAAGLSYSFLVDNSQMIYIVSASDGYVYVHDGAGNLVSIEGDYGVSSSSAKTLNWNNRFYFGRSTLDKIMNRVYINY